MKLNILLILTLVAIIYLGLSCKKSQDEIINETLEDNTWYLSSIIFA
jgi:predicted transposase YbfD/YdcC